MIAPSVRREWLAQAPCGLKETPAISSGGNLSCRHPAFSGIHRNLSQAPSPAGPASAPRPARAACSETAPGGRCEAACLRRHGDAAGSACQRRAARRRRGYSDVAHPPRWFAWRQPTKGRRAVKIRIIAAALAVATLAAPAASAQYGWRGGYGGYRGGYGYGWRAPRRATTAPIPASSRARCWARRARRNGSGSRRRIRLCTACLLPASSGVLPAAGRVRATPVYYAPPPVCYAQLPVFYTPPPAYYAPGW